MKIEEECDFKQEIKEEVIEDDITPFVDCDEGIKEEIKEEVIEDDITPKQSFLIFIPY